MNNVSLTIRQAVKTVFPQINDATIHSWMSKGVFRPYIYVPPPTGPGRGCMLNMADLVTIGVIHSLLRFGIKFNDLTKSNFAFFDLESNKICWTFAELYELSVGVTKAERKVQFFLEKYAYKVWVAWTPIIASSIYQSRHNSIDFYPHDNEKMHGKSLQQMTETDFPAMGHLFINCATWLDHIQLQLGLL